jgi:hypothetical protein
LHNDAISARTRRRAVTLKILRNWAPKPKPAEIPPVTLGSARPFIYKGETYTNLVVNEPHFTPSDLAKAWGLSAEKVRQLFRNESGVLRLASSDDSRARGYVTLRNPQSVAVRVHTRLLPFLKPDDHPLASAYPWLSN